MLKDISYKKKFEIVQPWLLSIIETVKKDLKQEHLKIDRAFCKKYFLGKNLPQILIQEMVSAYQEDIAQGNVGLAEFIASRWLLRHTDIYGYFENALKSIQPDFEEIQELEEEFALKLMEKSVIQFGAIFTYIFCVFNSVVFSESVYAVLKNKAEEASLEKQQQEEVEALHSLADLRDRQLRELSAMTDKYEKKFSGMQQKYIRDTQNLKNQISRLQQKLAGVHE